MVGRIAGFAGSVLLLLGICLTLEVSAQGPKPPRKEEQEEDNPAKVKKKPLRVEDEEEAKRPPREAAVAVKPADLAVEARKASHAAVRELYRELSAPHDVVHWTSGTGKTMRIEPYPFRIAAGSKSKTNNLRLYRQDDNGKAGAAFPVQRSDVKQIEAYEDIALGLVKNFLDPKGAARSLPRLEAYRAAERALAAVVRYHESARTRGLREGEDWDEVERRVRDELLRVQIELVAALTEAKDWEPAYALVARLAETNRKPEVHARLAPQLARFVLQSLQEDNYAEARQRMRLMEELFPAASVSGQAAESLSRKAHELMQQAGREKDPVKAMAILTTAESLWPRLPGLRNEILKRNKAYPILYVGVPDLPQNFSPATACTDSERQAVELIFESLMKAVTDPEVGQRYIPELAEDRPRLIPLGREFQLARDAYWSNGTPVTAVDVRATVKLLKERHAAGFIEEVRSPEPYRVAILLRHGFLDPLSLMTFKVLPQSAQLERADDPKFAKQPIGSGPFMLIAATPESPGNLPQGGEKKLTTVPQGKLKVEGGAVRFVANENYRRAGKAGLPRIREVVFYHSKNPGADFAAGRLDLLLDADAVARLGKTPRVQVHVAPNPRIYFLAVNHRKPALQNTDLRRAIAVTIDRTKILDDIFRTGFKDEATTPHRPLNGPFPCGTWACKPEMKHETCNPVLGKELADKAKNALRDRKLTLKYPNHDGRVLQACEAIRDQLRAIGVDIQLEPRSPAQIRREVEVEHNYDLAYYQHDFQSEAYLLWPLFDPDGAAPGGSNYLGYQNDKELQSLLQKAILRRDFEEVRKLSQTTHMLFCEKMPFIPLWQLDTVFAIHADLKTHPVPRQLDPLRIFTDVERWELNRGE